MGTPQYMAPEQIEHPLQVDHRADIYSLGVVFYQMLTGELPIGRFAPPSKKVQIDVRLDEVVLRALEKEPERRYQQASELKTRVETIATTPSSPASGATGTAGAFHAPYDDAPSTRPGRQVKGPAIGLLITGMLSLLTVPMFVLVWSFEGVPTNGMESRTAPHGAETMFPIVMLLAVLLGCLLPGILVILAATKMMRLQGYALAITASILAIVVSPTNLIGLPIGIRSLVVLTQRDVRAAFGVRGRRNRVKKVTLVVSAVILLWAWLAGVVDDADTLLRR